MRPVIGHRTFFMHVICIPAPSVAEVASLSSRLPKRAPRACLVDIAAAVQACERPNIFRCCEHLLSAMHIRLDTEDGPMPVTACRQEGAITPILPEDQLYEEFCEHELTHIRSQATGKTT